MVVVAVAVSIWTAGALSGLGAVMAGAIGGAAGSVASQGVGIAIGAQKGFSFKQVAMGAIGGAVGGALKGVQFASGAFANGAIRGALSSAATQGIGVATGLQSKFDWAGVAAAGIGGGVSSHVTGKLAGAVAAGTFGANVANGISAVAGGLANAGARTIMTGTSFGDNLIAALPDIIGNTIGNMIGDGVTPDRWTDEGGEGRIQTAANAQQGLIFDLIRGANAQATDYATQYYESNVTVTGTRDAVIAGMLAGIGGAPHPYGTTYWSAFGPVRERSFAQGNWDAGTFQQRYARPPGMVVNVRPASNGGWRISNLFRPFTARASIDRGWGDQSASFSDGMQARLNGADSMEAAMIQRRSTYAILSRGMAYYTTGGPDMALGGLVAPLDMGQDAVAGVGVLITNPRGALRGAYTSLTTPSQWFSGLRGALANGDAFGMGLYGTRAVLDSAATAEGIGAVTSMARRGTARLGGSSLTLSRTFASPDPYVGELATMIDQLYPGHVIGVNVPMRNASGQLIGDADILLQNSVIQVKGSPGLQGVVGQMSVSQGYFGRPSIGYGPNFTRAAVASAQRNGSLVTNNEALLLQLIRPTSR